jgi:hypothetical protein
MQFSSMGGRTSLCGPVTAGVGIVAGAFTAGEGAICRCLFPGGGTSEGFDIVFRVSYCLGCSAESDGWLSSKRGKPREIRAFQLARKTNKLQIGLDELPNRSADFGNMPVVNAGVLIWLSF